MEMAKIEHTRVERSRSAHVNLSNWRRVKSNQTQGEAIEANKHAKERYLCTARVRLLTMEMPSIAICHLLVLLLFSSSAFLSLSLSLFLFFSFSFSVTACARSNKDTQSQWRGWKLLVSYVHLID